MVIINKETYLKENPMNREARFSEVPVGDEFEYNGQVYTRHSCGRARQLINKKVVYTWFPKHRIVLWMNAYPNNIEG